jgi:hypothetical protein
MIETLKFPAGDFTHTELAKFNGKTNQQVWTRYQQAIKDGIIVSAGNRASAGKGKPSKLWRLATGQPVPVAAVVSPAPATAPAAVVPPVVVPTEAVVVPAVQPAPVIEAPKLPEVTPAVAPTPAATESSVEAVTVEVVRVEPAPEAEIKPPTVNDVVKDARTLTEKCPICGNPLLAVDDATGVMVWCAQSPEVCSANEAPFGHGKNDKEGYETLMDKWTRKVHA